MSALVRGALCCRLTTTTADERRRQRALRGAANYLLANWLLPFNCARRRNCQRAISRLSSTTGSSLKLVPRTKQHCFTDADDGTVRRINRVTTDEPTRSGGVPDSNSGTQSTLIPIPTRARKERAHRSERSFLLAFARRVGINLNLNCARDRRRCRIGA